MRWNYSWRSERGPVQQVASLQFQLQWWPDLLPPSSLRSLQTLPEAQGPTGAATRRWATAYPQCQGWHSPYVRTYRRRPAGQARYVLQR